MPLSGRRSKFIREEPLKQWALAIPMRLAGNLAQFPLPDEARLCGGQKQNVLLDPGSQVE